jgi:hypothetical protein
MSKSNTNIKKNNIFKVDYYDSPNRNCENLNFQGMINVNDST